MIKDLKLKKKDSSLIFSPPHYAMGFSQILTYMINQMSFVFINSGTKFPETITQSFIRYKLSIINLSISSFRILHPNLKKNKTIFQNVRLIMSGGMQMTFDIINNYKKIFPKAKIINFYGCTENSPRISHFHINHKKIDKGGETVNAVLSVLKIFNNG